MYDIQYKRETTRNVIGAMVCGRRVAQTKGFVFDIQISFCQGTKSLDFSTDTTTLTFVASCHVSVVIFASQWIRRDS
jgi:hypothetical protein